MDKPKYTARIENIYFLERVGETLRWATQDIADEELPANIKQLLARLDRLEAGAVVKRQRPIDDPSTRATYRQYSATPNPRAHRSAPGTTSSSSAALLSAIDSRNLLERPRPLV